MRRPRKSMGAVRLEMPRLTPSGHSVIEQRDQAKHTVEDELAIFCVSFVFEVPADTGLSSLCASVALAEFADLSNEKWGKNVFRVSFPLLLYFMRSNNEVLFHLASKKGRIQSSKSTFLSHWSYPDRLDLTLLKGWSVDGSGAWHWVVSGTSCCGHFLEACEPKKGRSSLSIHGAVCFVWLGCGVKLRTSPKMGGQNYDKRCWMFPKILTHTDRKSSPIDCILTLRSESCCSEMLFSRGCMRSMLLSELWAWPVFRLQAFFSSFLHLFDANALILGLKRKW